MLVGEAYISNKTKHSNSLCKIVLERQFLKLFFKILQRVPGENPRAKRSEMDSFTKH